MMKTRQVAERCGVTTETVRDWAAAGKLRVAERTPGGQLRFALEDVEAVMRGPASSPAVDDLEGQRIEAMLLKAKGCLARVLPPVRTA